MKLFKLIEIDLVKERKRINRPIFNERQRKVLLTLIGLFEAGEFQKCLDLVNDKKAFSYNEKEEYDEKEHIGIEIGHILRGISYESYYTQKEILDEAQKKRWSKK